jgi:hypothetical protein
MGWSVMKILGFSSCLNSDYIRVSIYALRHFQCIKLYTSKWMDNWWAGNWKGFERGRDLIELLHLRLLGGTEEDHARPQDSLYPGLGLNRTPQWANWCVVALVDLHSCSTLLEYYSAYRTSWLRNTGMCVSPIRLASCHVRKADFGLASNCFCYLFVSWYIYFLRY